MEFGSKMDLKGVEEVNNLYVKAKHRYSPFNCRDRLAKLQIVAKGGKGYFLALLNINPDAMLKVSAPILLFFIQLIISGCNDTPMVVFHSYDELTDYPFFGSSWVPEIVQEDITDIRETYAVENGHVFGRLDFTRRPVYDSIFSGYSTANQDSLLAKINSIKRPEYPDWFIPEKEITSGKYSLARHKGFYLFLHRTENRMYFLK